MADQRGVVAAVVAALALAACPDLQLEPAGGHGGATTSASSSGTGSTSSSGGGSASSGSSASSSSGTGGAGAGGGGSGSGSGTGGSGGMCMAGAVPDGGVGATLLGDDQVESSTNPHDAGLADASSFVAIGNGPVNSLTVYYEDGNATQLLVGLYDDAAGQPSHLLASGVVSHPVRHCWNTAQVPAVSVEQGKTYWIALVEPIGSGTKFSFQFLYETGKGDSVHSDATLELSTMPSVWPPGDVFPNTHCSFYASE